MAYSKKARQRPENEIDTLCDKVPCRRQQFETLLALLGKKEQYTIPALFIYGHPATGKSLVIRSMLNQMQAKYVVVNCIEFYNNRLLFEHILNTLSGITPQPSNNFMNYGRCDNINDFVRLFRQIIEDENLMDETVFLVFENAERLRDREATLLSSLLRFQELSDNNVTVILESEIVWEKFRAGTGSVEPYVLFFPNYSKAEIVTILSVECPENCDTVLYKNYLNLLLSVFHHVCQSLTELRYLAVLNFPKFFEPIEKKQANQDDIGKLWRNVEPHLKKALQTVYLREISSAQWENMQKKSIEQGSSISLHGLSSRFDLELPFYSKYLLIAAYLASYNPAKSDKRFFAKNSGKINKRRQIAQKKNKSERTSTQLLGPKPFPLDRLMAIFFSIVEGKVAPTANIFSQVCSLVSLGLLSQAGVGDPLESPKYKCLVSLDFIKGVARSVQFEIIRYLFDFI